MRQSRQKIRFVGQIMAKEEIKELTSKARNLKADRIVGFGIGCICNAIANN